MTKSMGVMRKANTLNAILHIIRSKEKASKFQIQKISKYSMTTVLTAIEELQEKALIRPIGKGPSNGGRRPDYFAINPEGGYFVGIEFNAQAIHAVALDFGLSRVNSRRIVLETGVTAQQLLDRVMAVTGEIVSSLQESNARIFGIGIGSAGLVDHERGIALSYHELKTWLNVPLKEIMEKAFGVPAWIDNNVNMIAVGCQHAKPSQHMTDFILFSIRKGIRISTISDNVMHHGVTNSAGSIGHTPVQRLGRTCSCGRRGCLDAEASDDAVQAKLLEGIRKGRYSDLFESVDRDPGRVNIATFVDSVLSGHPESLELLDELCEFMGIALTHAVNLLNPPRVIIYGEITRIGKPFLDRIRFEVEHHAVQSTYQAMQIELAEQDHLKGAVGAAITVLHKTFPFVSLLDEA